MEISNGNRVIRYLREIGNGLPGDISESCLCDALDDDYPFVDQASDPAPWFDANVPESEEFFGLWLSDVLLQPVMSRNSTSRAGGGIALGNLSLGKRIIQCKGLLFASSGEGMAFGERWLNRALAGSFCAGSCAADDLQILPACPEVEDSYYGWDPFFRTLINTGVIDGPNFGQISGFEDCLIQTVDFQLASGPYLFGSKQALLTDYELANGDSVSVMASTNHWPGDGVLVISAENPDTTFPAKKLTIESHVSFDGTCDNLEGMPCWFTVADEIGPGEILFIDAQREEVLLYKPGPKVLFPGLSKLSGTQTFPFFDFPTVPPCTDLCVSFANEALFAGDPLPLILNVDFYPRTF